MSDHSPAASSSLDHSSHAAVELTQEQRTRILRRFKLVTVCVLGSLALGGVATFLVRQSQAETAAEHSRLQNIVYVTTVRAKSGASGQSLSMPGTLQGYIESPIAARVSGYLVRWNKDIGSRVAKGEVLAEISTPEVDQQLAQAMAERQQIASTLELAKVSMERWQNLRAQNAVSQQEFDERRSTYLQSTANLEAADANIRRLKEMQSFKRIVAPFSGVITRRNVNIGDLIQVGGANSALFTLAQTDPLRVYVYVPQSYTGQVKTGMGVSITQAEIPGQTFSGKIVRTAGAIDPSNRSMQAEISLPNNDGKLLPGAYVNVSVPVAASDALIVPSNTLLIRSEGPRIGVVDEKGQVRLHPVVIGKDFGLNVQILSGITANDNLVLNPPDSLADGDKVTIIQPKNGTSKT